MKLALLGYGKMGKLIEELAQRRGHAVIARFSTKLGKLQRTSEIEQADMVIDFSHASAVEQHVQVCLAAGKPLVIGTTGWDHLIKVQHMIDEKIGCLFAPNFSIGCYLFKQITAFAASLFQPFSEYDVQGIEYHHKEKKDSPSGTAKALIKEMLPNIPRLQSIPFSSIRVGYFPGTHNLVFDSPVDTIVLTHEARSRDGFAEGAILAAEWLIHRKGFYTLDEMMQDYLKGIKS